MARDTATGRVAAACLGLVLIAPACALLAGAQAGESPQRHTVEIRGFAFDPAALQASPGDTLVWVNRDLVPHTVTANNGKWDSGELTEGEAWELVVGNDFPAVQSYFCRYHPSMQGMLRAAPDIDGPSTVRLPVLAGETPGSRQR